MALFNNFPYSNTEEINLDYTLNKLNELYSRGENLYAELQAWKTATDEANEAWKSDLLSDINEWQTSVTHSLEEWKTSVDSEVSNALTTLSNQITAELAQAKTDLRNEVADLASAAAASAADAAACHRAAAQSAETAINSAAAAAQSEQNIAESAEQIKTNTDNISDLKKAVDFSGYVDPTKNIAVDLMLTDGYINTVGAIVAATSAAEKTTSAYRINPKHTYRVTITQPVALGQPWAVYGIWTELDIYSGRGSFTFDTVDDLYIAEKVFSGIDFYKTDFIRFSFRTYDSTDSKITIYDITDNIRTYPKSIINITNGIGDYTYYGDTLNLTKNQFIFHKLAFNPPYPSGEIMQGIAITGDTMVQGYSSGKLQLINMLNGSQIAIYDANAGHCGSLSFGNEYYNDNSQYPKLYVASYDENKTFVFDISDTYCNLIDTYIIPTDQAGYRQQSAIDSNGNLWVMGHVNDSYTEGGGLILSEWDLNNSTESDIGKTPTLIFKTNLPWRKNLQSITCVNNQIFALFGNVGVTADTATRIDVIRAHQTYISTVITDFPTVSNFNIKQYEPEGITSKYNDSTGKYDIYIATRQIAFYVKMQF